MARIKHVILSSDYFYTRSPSDVEVKNSDDVLSYLLKRHGEYVYVKYYGEDNHFVSYSFRAWTNEWNDYDWERSQRENAKRLSDQISADVNGWFFDSPKYPDSGRYTGFSDFPTFDDDKEGE